MKRLSYLLLLVFLLGSCATSSQKKKTNTQRKNASLFFVSGMEHDFGEYREQEVKQCTFIYKNQGKKPLVIYRAESDCGCTQVKFKSRPLPPGKVDSLLVSYDGNGFLNGSFQKTIRIYSNASDKPLELKIKGSYFHKNKEL